MEQSEKALTKACGGYCVGCLDFLAYINNDEELKKKLAKQFSKELGMDIKPEDVGCLGCHGTIHKPWCASCSLQRCTEEKGIPTCSFCDEFPCEKLETYYQEHGESEGRAHLLRQKKIGLEKWLEEVKKAGQDSRDT